LSDFKTNEYASLIGDAAFELMAANPASCWNASVAPGP